MATAKNRILLKKGDVLRLCREPAPGPAGEWRITGYVGENTYHAWNSFYLKNQGWVTVEIKAQPKSWQRVDITFAAGGTSAEKLLNDERYTTRFVY